jgi:hypothetical protein
MKKITLAILLLILIGCTKQLQQDFIELPTNKLDKNISFTISYDSSYAFDAKHYYNLRSSVKQAKNTTYILYYNKKVDYYFDLCKDFNTTNCTRIRPTFVDSAFIKGGQSVYAVYLHNLDSLFALTEKNIYIFDTTGKVINTINYIESKIKTFKNYELNFDQNEKPFYYSALTKTIYISAANISLKKGAKEAVREDLPIVLQYNIITQKWSANKLRLTELFRDHDFYIANQYFTNYTGNTISLCFEVDPNIYLYDIINDTVTSVGGRSAHADSIPRGFEDQFKYNNDELFTWFMQIPRYESKLIHDPYRHFYYRIFFKPMSLKNDRGLYNTQWDKVPVLMVFDEQYNLLKEFDLEPGKIVAKKPFVTSKGLYLDLRTQQEAASRTYMVIDVK